MDSAINGEIEMDNQRQVGLTLEFENKVNPNLAKYSQPPIEFRGDNIIILKNRRESRYNDGRTDIVSEEPLCDINTFLGSIDEEEFAKVTALEYTRKLQNKIDEFERYYGNYMRRATGIDYRLETKRNYDWKNGMYDFLKAYSAHSMGFNMRNSGVNRYFIRLGDGARRLRSIQNHFERLEILRMDCKKNVGKVIENVDEVIEQYKSNLNQIQNSTEVANQMSSNYQVYNAVNFTAMESSPPYNGFLNLQLHTIIVAKENMISITNTEGNIISEMPTPKSYLIFSRKFGEVLLGKSKPSNIQMQAATSGFYHPYISSVPYYNLEESSDDGRYRGVYRYPWGSLCLSSHTDDITKAICKNDYSALLMKISNWNKLYNNNSTNPHNTPARILYHTGINPDSTREDIDTVKYLLNFSSSRCFDENIEKHRSVQDNPLIRIADEVSEGSYLEYADIVVDECDVKECPLRKECTKYTNVKLSQTIPDLYEMVESLQGWILEYHNSTGDFSWSDTRTSRKMDDVWNQLIRETSRLKRFPRWVDNLTSSFDYYPTDEDGGEIADADGENSSMSDAERTMQQAVRQWTESINSQGGTPHGR